MSEAILLSLRMHGVNFAPINTSEAGAGPIQKLESSLKDTVAIDPSGCVTSPYVTTQVTVTSEHVE